MLKAILAFGLIGSRRDSATSRNQRVEKRDSPFVLVAWSAADGRWGVFQRDFDKPQALFDEMQEACDFANVLAKTCVNSMVLIRRQAGPPSTGGLPDGLNA